MKQRVLVVRVGSETVQAIVNDDRIWRIEISSPRLATGDSLGVDTPLHMIATMRGARFFPGEDGVYGFVANHCAIRVVDSQFRCDHRAAGTGLPRESTRLMAMPRLTASSSRNAGIRGASAATLHRCPSFRISTARDLQADPCVPSRETVATRELALHFAIHWKRRRD